MLRAQSLDTVTPLTPLKAQVCTTRLSGSFGKRGVQHRRQYKHNDPHYEDFQNRAPISWGPPLGDLGQAFPCLEEVNLHLDIRARTAVGIVASTADCTPGVKQLGGPSQSFQKPLVQEYALKYMRIQLAL